MYMRIIIIIIIRVIIRDFFRHRYILGLLVNGNVPLSLPLIKEHHISFTSVALTLHESASACTDTKIYIEIGITNKYPAVTYALTVYRQVTKRVIM